MTLDEAFAGLADPRTGPAQRHDLREMILMVLCAVLCGADTWVDVAEWAEDNESWLRRYLELVHGTPSHDTFSRVFRILDARMFEQCFRSWIAGLVGVIEGVVALDGKTMCGSRDGENTALHMVSAYATASGLCLGQEGTRGKGNEIAAIKALLDTLTLMVQRRREINGKTSTERAFYIGSKGIADAEAFANAARSHWRVENGLHWVLDVTFREDDCRVRTGHAPQNLSALRKFALALLRQDKQYPKRSLRGRRKTADRLPDYRASLLSLTPRG